MLSGIGPKNDLEKLNIPVIKNLEVGRHLQDHVIHGGHVYLINNTAGLNIYDILSPGELQGSAKIYFQNVVYKCKSYHRRFISELQNV